MAPEQARRNLLDLPQELIDAILEEALVQDEIMIGRTNILLTRKSIYNKTLLPVFLKTQTRLFIPLVHPYYLPGHGYADWSAIAPHVDMEKIFQHMDRSKNLRTLYLWTHWYYKQNPFSKALINTLRGLGWVAVMDSNTSTHTVDTFEHWRYADTHWNGFVKLG